MVKKITNLSSFGLLAGDTSYSQSPLIHNFSARKLSLGYSYKGYDLTEDALEIFLSSFFSHGGLGLNVSNPFKKKVIPYLSSCELESVNTIKLESGSLKGYSTDGEGFWNALLRYEKDLEQYSAFCFFGSGDVLPSIMAFLKTKLNRKPVFYIRRSQKNDDVLMDLYPRSSFLPFCKESLFKVLEKYNGKKICLVQATSAPSHGYDLSEFIPALSSFEGLFCDLLYSTPSKIFSVLQEQGHLVLDGLPMLIEQALLSQKIWWGKSASYESVLKELSKNLSLKGSFR